MKNQKANFSVVTPSWVMPGTYLENINFLSGKNAVNGVELLFFLYDEEIRAGFQGELPEIKKFTERFMFTAHLPDKLNAGHEELVRALSPLVKHFIVHPSADAPEQARYIKDWMDRYGARRFLLENTVPGRLEVALPYFDACMPICMDTAHLLLEGASPADFVRRYGGRINEVHLNGTDGGDGGHKPFNSGDEWFLELAPFLRSFSGVVNIELFSWDEIRRSIDCLEKLFENV
ncbi:MAG: TIM barrel protein [Spirochaetaceae bacterium]|jgi:hypothetical protein|nr:TIM barrel protein [Spirochaetaceae bacterium]